MQTRKWRGPQCLGAFGPLATGTSNSYLDASEGAVGNAVKLGGCRFVGCTYMVVGCWLLVVGCCLLFVVCCLLFVVCCCSCTFGENKRGGERETDEGSSRSLKTIWSQLFTGINFYKDQFTGIIFRKSIYKDLSYDYHFITTSTFHSRHAACNFKGPKMSTRPFLCNGSVPDSGQFWLGDQRL